MTTRATDDPAMPDPRFDALWRAASREEPPPTLDAAILAAARRDVGAGPQRVRRDAASPARRQWWPLAAAATVAAIAVGVVQLVTHEELGAPTADNAVVTDMPRQAAEPASKPSASAPEKVTLAQRQEGASSGRPVLPAESPRRSAPNAALPAQRKSDPATNNVSALPEPFPAASQLGAATVSDAKPASPPGNSGEIAASAPAVQPPPSAAVADTSVDRAVMRRDAAGGAAPVASSAPMPPVPGFAGTPRVPGMNTAPASPLSKSVIGATRKDEEGRAKESAPLPIPDWIALIRRLRTEGKTADAARELAAFRVAHTDHERLLPPDLRDWRPAEK